jgi:hypothetical protein
MNALGTHTLHQISKLLVRDCETHFRCAVIRRYSSYVNSEYQQPWGFEDKVSRAQMGELLNGKCLSVRVQIQILEDPSQVLRPILSEALIRSCLLLDDIHHRQNDSILDFSSHSAT